MDKKIRLIATAMALGIISNSCGLLVRGASEGGRAFSESQVLRQGRHGALTADEKLWASAAWKYFENNFNPQTGLVNSVDNYQTTTMWHAGDYLFALMAAKELQIINENTFDDRISRLVNFLNSMNLFEGKLPNTVYSTMTGKMVNYAGQESEQGWSAIDNGRLLTALRVLRNKYPAYREYADKIVLRFNFCEILKNNGALYGAVKVNGKTELYRENNLVYEEYAAKGYQVWGFDTTAASSIEPYETIKIYGVEIRHDRKETPDSGGYTPVLSLPYILDGIEYNWDKAGDTGSLDSVHSDQIMAELAESIYKVQESRYQTDRIFTARTDHQLGYSPYFVYDSIFAAGYPWNTISDNGTAYPDTALVSTRAAFGLWALWKTDYTDNLIQTVNNLYDSERGWYEGRYEKTGNQEKLATCTTNAMVLQSLLYKKAGKLRVLAPETKGYYETVLADEFRRKGNQCFPPDRVK